MNKTDETRIHRLNSNSPGTEGPVIYWMNREQRLDDNWGFIHSLELASVAGKRVEVVFCFDPDLHISTQRNISFIKEGLQEVAERAGELSVPFRVFCGSPSSDVVGAYAEKSGASAVVCDFSPLRENLAEASRLARRLDTAVIEVDGHNIVPCRFVSSRQEFGAHTLRKKIEKLLPQYLTGFPSPEELISEYGILPAESGPADWALIDSCLKPETSVAPVESCVPGYTAGMKRLEEFLAYGLGRYETERNDPNADAQSGLSPYLHHGQISAQTAAEAAARWLGSLSLKGGFLDEIIVRRELSDNFCLYNQDYDNAKGFPSWAAHSLAFHRMDKREVVHSLDDLESAHSYDPLWNAAQVQLTEYGKMHGYLRMYWAKKILEWSDSPEEAMRRAVYLNDKYSLDGKDPNGYAGCAWAIGGVHDRAWAERPVFGKIRYMNYSGCRRKFNVARYIASVTGKI